MKIKVISSIRNSDRDFYRKCTNSQQEWCSLQRYEYQLYENLTLRNINVKWRNFTTLVASLAESQSGDVIVLMNPSVMIMDPEAEMPLLTQIKKVKEGVWVAQSETIIFYDVIVVKVGPRVNKGLSYVSTFFDTPHSVPDFSLDLFRLFYPDLYFSVDRRVLSSSWYTNSVNMMEIKAVIEKDKDPDIYVNRYNFDNMNSLEFMYAPGDFAVDLSSNKYLCSAMAEEFFIFRRNFLKTRKEAKQIINEIYL